MATQGLAHRLLAISATQNPEDHNNPSQEKVLRHSPSPSKPKKASKRSSRKHLTHTTRNHLASQKNIDPTALNDDEKSAWEKVASAEVAKAVEGLSA
ncbi:hypothetical protein V491_08785 [Pseudogymnoascus sp. VKM F-3775]|nr:hypothetical protein V491_08785 [Pseudogymnoascus sp. VKM F-3775]